MELASANTGLDFQDEQGNKTIKVKKNIQRDNQMLIILAEL